MVAQTAVPAALRIQEIERETAADTELQVVRQCLVDGNWNNCAKPYRSVRNELTFIGHVILRGTRLVIPSALRTRVLDLAHEGHQGVVKTKERLHSKVWWPGIDQAAEKKCKACYGCQLVTKTTQVPPLKPTVMPQRPWEELAMDLLGPMPSGEYLLVLVDYFSRWMEVDIIRSISSETIRRRLDAHFSRHGIPRAVRTDNADDYLQELGIKHRHTIPLWPRANGEVERQNRSLLKAMRVAHAEGRRWQIELNKFLLAYRSTRHSTTGKSPAELLFGRKLTTKLPEFVPIDEQDDLYQDVRDRDSERKQANKDYIDQKFHASDKDIQEGDLVLLEKKKENKLSSAYEKEPYQVVTRQGDQVSLRSTKGGEQYKRNLQHVKPFVKPDLHDSKTPDVTDHKDTYLDQEVKLRRSNRVVRKPKALDDFVIWV